jgi:hypothetical protein
MDSASLEGLDMAVPMVGRMSCKKALMLLCDLFYETDAPF